MIRVKRSAAPAVLVGPNSKAAAEKKQVNAHYADSKKRSKPFKGYSVYKDPAVKQELNRLFHNKCAYCEIGYGGASMDVEHFRPKGRVVEFDVSTMEPTTPAEIHTPGYYWLASEWTNLLPACQHCNRPTTHTFAGLADRTTGKWDFFPLAPKTKRRLGPRSRCQETEDPLLLDPTVDRPGDHFEFGDKGTIRPKQTRKGPSLRGTVSIEIFGLQRDLLVRERESRASLLRLQIATIRRETGRLQIDADDAEARQALTEAIAGIRANFLAPDKPFLAMVRQIVIQELGWVDAKPPPAP